MWHVTCDTWHMTSDTWHMTCDMWHVVGGEHSLKISAPSLIWFVIYDILKIRRKRLTEWLSDEADCRTAPATPGLLIIHKKDGRCTSSSLVGCTHLKAVPNRLKFPKGSVATEPIEKSTKGEEPFCLPPLVRVQLVQVQWVQSDSKTNRVL